MKMLMKKLLVWIWLICIGNSFVSSQSDFSEFQIFKDDAIQQVYENDEYIPLMDMNQAKKDLAELARSYDEVVASVAVLDTRKKSISKHYNSARIAAQATIQDMKDTQDTLSKRQTQVSLSLNKIRNLEALMVTLLEDIQISKKQISRYSKFLFKTSNDFYLSGDELSNVKLLTKSTDIAQTLSQEEISRLLYEWLEKAFAHMQDLTQEYQSSLQEIQSHIVSYHQQIDLHQKDLAQLDQQREHVEQLLSFLSDDKAFLDQQIDRFESSQRDLQSQMDRMDDITTKTELFLSKNKKIDDLLNEDDKALWSDYFSRPIRIPRWIHEKETWWQYINESGVALVAAQWEEIYAPAPGIVYKVHQSNDLSLSWAILLHKYGYSTVILPLSDIYVSAWDVVRRWEIIWLAGGKPWTTWAWLESSDAYVYLEILKNSEPIDPYLVMDISVYPSIDVLDEQYHLKWKQDYLARTIDLSDIPTLKWDTPQERSNYFLSKSGNSIFSDPWLWLEAAKGTWIDPIFGICIGAAETSYRNFKSGNNIGNVGNNDRGDTVIYDSPTAWVRAIYQTLGNKYLGEYTMMNQLSRFGNDDGSIYASDPINRQKNIMRCLSMIYEVNVPEDYFFRIK